MRRKVLLGAIIASIFLFVGCGDHEHKYGEWQITTVPGCEVEGERSRTCSDCGEVGKEAIPAQGHNFVNNVCTECGAEK